MGVFAGQGIVIASIEVEVEMVKPSGGSHENACGADIVRDLNIVKVVGKCRDIASICMAESKVLLPLL